MEVVLDRENEFLWSNNTYEFLSSKLNTSIETINLATDHIEVDSVKLIESMLKNPSSNLIELNFDQCRLREESTKILIKALSASKILYLSLNRNVITDSICNEIAQYLSQDPPLEYLSLASCNISAEGCCIIAKALPMAKQLKTFIINSNCIFDKGCEAIAENIKNTNINELSVSDNQIWIGGTSALLKALTSFPSIKALDLSFNIIDLALLAQCIKETPNLEYLSISGCKVNESQVLLFLEELGKTQLSTFIIEGLNFNQLPISWPHSQDVLWSSKTYFEVLHKSIRYSQNLIDLRLGFIDIKQIYSLYNLYQTNVITRPITVSISDFGRTHNNWVLSFPDFTLEAPSAIFKWGSRIFTDEAHLFSSLFKKSTFNGQPLDTLDISNTNITDDILQKLLVGFDNVHLKLFDLSMNDITDTSVETITPFFEHSRVEQLFLNDTHLTEFGFQRFFRYFVKNRPTEIPKVLKFSFSLSDSNNNNNNSSENNNESELHFHQFFNELADLIQIDAPIKEIEINGNVTPKDMIPIFSNLSKNSHLKKIVIPFIPAKYKSSDYDIENDIQECYNELIDALSHALIDEDSQCILEELEYPLLTTVFLFSDDILDLWGKIETQIAKNKENNDVEEEETNDE